MAAIITSEEVGRLIDQFAAMTTPDAGPGVTRLAYTPLERRAHQAFTAYLEEAGLRVSTDAGGNTIAERPGSDPGLPAIGTGSHLDSVPNAGSYDGIAGVVAAMVVARALAAERVEHRHPFRFVVFAGEEGARFGQACTGSRIVAGLSTAADLRGLRDKDGVSIADAMRAIDIDPELVGQARWRSRDWSAFVELHIEQGSVLADAKTPIGVVDLISGSTRFQVTLDGRASHSGGTPMHARADALAAAAEILVAAESLALDPRHHGTRITVGRLDVAPNSITTIPGRCVFSVDVRDVDTLRQRDAANQLLAKAAEVAQRRGVTFAARLLGDASPALLSASVQQAIITAATSCSLGYRVMPSGASHDSQMVSRVVPAGMIFVPSLNHGVSHSPDEATASEDLAAGAGVLIEALLELDRRLDA